MNEIITKGLQSLLHELFPIYRSITGPGNLETLKVIQREIPIKILEYHSGETVFDWIVPSEYKVNQAWISNSSGKKLIDFEENNLHLVSYSVPVDRKMHFDELEPKLSYLPSQPDAIPYRTYYYNRDWGFCLTKKQYDALAKEQGELHVFIDSSFDKKGKMLLGELLLEGKSKKEILISTYICHPSMANDNLSGIVVSLFLVKYLLSLKQTNYSYRFVFLPETIGAIAYCARNKDIMRKIDVGFVLSTIGGPGALGFKESWQSNHWINDLVREVLFNIDPNAKRYVFDPHGSDERQYSSPGFRINCPVVTKDKFYEYDYYHTSKDDLDFVSGRSLEISLSAMKGIIKRLEKASIYHNIRGDCEVMLSKHNLYPKMGGAFQPEDQEYSQLDLVLWLLQKSDGSLPVEYIAKDLGIDVKLLEQLSDDLVVRNIFEKIV